MSSTRAAPKHAGKALQRPRLGRSETPSTCDGLRDDDLVFRMNGCERPYIAEIGLVSRQPGLYNLYFGAAFDESRLNKLYPQDIDKARIVSLLTPLINAYAKERRKTERFGDFVIRTGVVMTTTAGNRFHTS
jgi:sulfite reductase (NADPH) hemoprotein beta-component